MPKIIISYELQFFFFLLLHKHINKNLIYIILGVIGVIVVSVLIINSIMEQPEEVVTPPAGQEEIIQKKSNKYNTYDKHKNKQREYKN